MIDRRFNTSTASSKRSASFHVAAVILLFSGFTASAGWAVAEEKIEAKPTGTSISGDPTTPGKTISRLLRPPNSPVTPADKPRESSGAGLSADALQLKGMVTRDQHHGTVLLLLNNRQSCVIQLDRASLQSAPVRLRTGQVEWIVIDFDRRSVTLQHAESGRCFVLR